MRSPTLLLCILTLTFAAAAQAAPKPGVFLQYDLTRVDTAPPGIDDHSGWRRARLSLSGPLGGGDGKLEYDFESETWTDVYLRFALAGGRVWLGQFKQPGGADALLSDTQATFTENAVAGAFAPGRRLGVQYQRGGLSVAAWSHDLHDAGPDAAIGARYTRGFGSADTRLWHLGGFFNHESPQGDRTSLRLRPEVGSGSGSWLASGSLRAETLQRVGLEGGLQHGRLLLLGEWARAEFDGDDARSRHADGTTLTAAWTLFGAPRTYAGGLFGTPKPPASGLGQVEVVARHARIDIPGAAGGELGQRAVSLGLNAQWGRHWRVMLDHHASERRPDGANARLWTLRLQFLY